MKILWITTLNVPVCFWRVEQIARYFFENWREKSPIGSPIYPHVEYFFHPDTNICWESFIQYAEDDDNARTIYDAIGHAFEHFDIIICQGLQYRPGLNRIKELKIKHPETILLMELDDCFDEFPPSNFKAINAVKDQFNIQAEQAVISDGIIASTKYLGNKLQKYNNNIYVLPNTVYKKMEHWQAKKPETYEREYVDFAFVGAGGHEEDLKLLYRAMFPLMDEGFKFGIYYSAYRPLWLKPHKNLIFETWAHHISKYYEELLKINTGYFLAPLRDTEFNRCKSDIKVIEANMCNKRIICSDVEPYKSVGKKYRTKNDPESWVNVLRRNAKNINKSSVKFKDKYKIEKVAPEFLRWLNKMIV